MAKNDRVIRVDYDIEDPTVSDDLSIRQCLAHWDGIRDDRAVPAWQAFDWTHIPYQIIPHTSVVDVAWDPFALTYRFWGTGRRKVFNKEMTGGSPLDLVPETLGRTAFNQHREAADSRRPQLFANRLSDGRQTIAESVLLLPFSEDGTHTSHIASMAVLHHSTEDAKDFIAGAILP